MLYSLKSIEKVNLEGKTVIVRSGLNTVIDSEHPETNIFLKASTPTIKFLLDKKCKVIVLAHYGNPKGETIDSLSLMDARFGLSHTLNSLTKFVTVANSFNSIKFMNPGELLILENIRFNKEEENSDNTLIEAVLANLVKLSDIFVLDTLNIDYVSNSIRYLAQKKRTYAGLSLSNELNILQKYTGKDFVLIIGNIESELEKIEINKLISKAKYVYSESDIKVDNKKKLKTLEDLFTKLDEVKRVLWYGKLANSQQKVLEYLTLVVGKDVEKVVGGNELIETLNNTRFKEKNIGYISVSGVNTLNLINSSKVDILELIASAR